MSDDTTDVRSWDCPAPGCSHGTGGAAELAEHVNSEHPGGYHRDGWPDTDAGRKKRASGDDDGDEAEE